MIDFIGLINTEATWLTPVEKTQMLDDFVTQHGWTGEEDPPVTKKDFGNKIIAQFIKDSVHAQRYRIGVAAVIFDELDLEG